MDIPAYYDYKNLYNSSWSPSTMHAQNTALKNFFARYLLQRAMAVYKWKLPKTWAKNYFLYTLYTCGFVIHLNTDKFGVIPQNGTLGGYNVFYQPRNAIVTNPLLKSSFDLEIGKDCTLVYMQPDYRPISDLISYYADLLAVCAETVGTNLFNSKVSYVFTSSNKSGAESFKKMFDKIASGEPAVFVDSKLLTPDGKPSWSTFAQNLRENYIAGDILDDMTKIMANFDTEIGIPNANTAKKERLITDEVNSNNFATYSKAAMWLENMKQGISETCEMFGISPDEYSVDWSENDAEEFFDDCSPAENESESISDDEPTGRDEPGNSR